ncbi:MAG: hypothetical protein ACLTDS_12410 [Bianqueaceae bacterium]
MVSRELSMFLAETIEELTGRLEADIAGGGPYDRRVFDAMHYSLAGGKRWNPSRRFGSARRGGRRRRPSICRSAGDDSYLF